MSADPAVEAAGLLLRTNPPMMVLRPGDRVLVALTEDTDPGVTNEIASGLRRSFPGVDFTVLTGVTSIAVQPGG